MTKITNMSSAIVDAQARVFSDLLAGGFIEFYGGEMPADADTPVANQVRGATLRFGDPVAFGDPAAGIVIARPIESAICERSIIATWARMSTRDHLPVQDVSVGVNDEVIIVPTTQFTAGCTVSIGFYAHTVTKDEGAAEGVAEF